jgi:hypothetical protein
VTQRLAFGYAASVDLNNKDRSADERDRRDIEIIGQGPKTA